MLELKYFNRDRDIIRQSEGRRFAQVEVVDEIIRLYELCNYYRRCLGELKNRKNTITEEVLKLKQQGQDATCRINDAKEIKLLISETEAELKQLWRYLCQKQWKVGNIVHDSVPVSNSQADNMIVRRWGVKREEADLKDHAELVECLGFADLDDGSDKGLIGYYLEGDRVLNQALINFGRSFLENKGYTFVLPPFFIQKDIIAKFAQSDETFHKPTGSRNDKYLVSAVDRPMTASQVITDIHPSQLPLKYAAYYSSCSRKEASSVVGEFEKLELFCLTSPNDQDSWKMHGDLITNSEEFYQMLEIPYQVVNVVSGELNLAEAKKYALEAWFPASRTYTELVSCSNCTDYQSRKFEIRYGQKKSDKEEKQYCHLLNSTLTATGRTMRCILENYQKEGGVEVPKVLQPFMGGQTFLPFKKAQGKRRKL